MRYRKTSITIRTKLKSKYGRSYRFIHRFLLVYGSFFYRFCFAWSLLFFMDIFIRIELWKKQFCCHCAKENSNVIQKVNWLKGNFSLVFHSLNFLCCHLLSVLLAKQKKKTTQTFHWKQQVSKLGICQRRPHISDIFNLNESSVHLHSGELDVPPNT